MSPQEFRDRRRRLGLNQEEFGRLLGYSRRGIAKLEAGEAPFKPALDFATRYLLEHPEACGTQAAVPRKARSKV
jgi:transcriptional regulator with XRE-family HTH domain